MKPCFHLLPVLFAGLLLFTSCGEKASSLTKADQQAFEKASPELKQSWDKLLAADKANDYVAALSISQYLLTQPLSEQQRQAVSTEMTAVNQRLFDAAAKGDPAARNALEELRKNPPNRRR